MKTNRAWRWLISRRWISRCSSFSKWQTQDIVTMILRDLDQLKDGAALRVPLAELGSTKENVRSALNRATRKAKRNVATATDEDFLYVWNVSKPSGA